VLLRLTPEARAAIRLTSFIKDVIVGLLLGDAWLQKLNSNQNTRLGFAQSGKEEKDEYFRHVLSLLSGLCTPTMVPYVKNFFTNGTPCISISFWTMRLPCLNLLHSLFYVNGIKVVPSIIFELLTPLGLAFWIMDDGSKQNTGLHLNTYSFTAEEHELLASVLRTKFGLAVTVHKHSAHNGKARLYIKGESMERLRVLVKPYMVPSMYYKIGLLDLLPYYAILRAVPNKLLGVVAMLGSLLILLAMPLLDTSRVRGGQFRPLWRAAFWFLVSDLVLLGWLGSQHAEEPFVTIGAIASIVYFAWYVILVPVVGIIENTLADLDAS